MALIINVDMPTSCGYACDLWSEGLCAPLQKSVDAHTIDHDCPILGEIPDKHGDLIQKMHVLAWIDSYAGAYSDEPALKKMFEDLRGEIDNLAVIVEATE